MATLTLTLLLSVGLQGYALTANNEINGLQMSPDTLEAGDVCKDCTQIFESLDDLLSNADLQKKIIQGIDSLCAYLPDPASKLCKDEVDKMLPVAITFVTGMAKPAEICKMIGLCSTSDQREKMLGYFVAQALQAAVKSENDKPTTQCSFCVFLVKTLEGLLPKERTEDAVIKLLEEICHIVPSSYRDQCEAIIGKFSKTVLDAIIGYATPEAICALIHLCKGQEALVVDPCTLPAYRCRDIRTALRCGTVFYCQKFTWKPLSYSTI
ncbi:prosaposin [Kryptolebias marmoratus]|uniref:prosaposin n=1 Tax=Kryptolebias marmoratus TaxID=37003 RepID=UPI0007F8CC24|nr:prosaposin [Kryptolebias marmoratus]XP_017266237.1 prosaposin [Kryptolebias marmoratus]